jgi:hypothetical protein
VALLLGGFIWLGFTVIVVAAWLGVIPGASR